MYSKTFHQIWQNHRDTNKAQGIGFKISPNIFRYYMKIDMHKPSSTFQPSLSCFHTAFYRTKVRKGTSRTGKAGDNTIWGKSALWPKSSKLKYCYCIRRSHGWNSGVLCAEDNAILAYSAEALRTVHKWSGGSGQMLYECEINPSIYC